jgi:hypothetical protein
VYKPIANYCTVLFFTVGMWCFSIVLVDRE